MLISFVISYYVQCRLVFSRIILHSHVIQLTRFISRYLSPPILNNLTNAHLSIPIFRPFLSPVHPK